MKKILDFETLPHDVQICVIVCLFNGFDFCRVAVDEETGELDVINPFLMDPNREYVTGDIKAEDLGIKPIASKIFLELLHNKNRNRENFSREYGELLDAEAEKELARILAE